VQGVEELMTDALSTGNREMDRKERDSQLATVTTTTAASQLKRPGLPATLLLLRQSDDLQTVLPNLADKDGLNDP
jgi:hypothetical protein